MGRWKKSEAPHAGGYESAKEREDKAFTLFSEMLIQKLEETKKSEWKALFRDAHSEAGGNEKE